MNLGTLRRDDTALRRFEHASDLPMLLLALLFALLLAIPILVPVRAETLATFESISWLIWAVFVVDLAIRLFLAPQRLRYAAAHWFDIVIVAVPFLRPLRLLRLVGPLMRVGYEARRLLARRGIAGALTFALLAVTTSSIAIWRIEAPAGGPIGDLPDAIWWAITTVTTVGYGDTFPITPEGRAVGAALMLVGIGVFGVVTASVAAFFVESSSTSELDELRESLRRIETALARAEEGSATDGAPAVGAATGPMTELRAE